MKKIVLLILCFFTSASFAGVYRCVGKNGEFEFRDRLCENSEESVFWPHQYFPTNKKISLNQEQALQKKRSPSQMTQKQIAKALAKRKRREQRCVQTKEKIKNAQQKLRTGCKVRKCVRLKEQLAHFNRMRNNYCEKE